MTTPRSRTALLAIGLGTLLAFAAGGCSRKLALVGRSCPCAAGYDCCGDRCVAQGSCPHDGSATDQRPPAEDGATATDQASNPDQPGADDQIPAPDHVSTPDQAAPLDTPITPPTSCPTPESPPCNPGLARCGLPECTIHLTTDHDNCGACGRNCREGECQGGECQPRTLATYSTTEVVYAHLAVNSTSIFWAVGTKVTAKDLTTGVERPVVDVDERFEGMTVDDQYLWYFDHGAECVYAWCLRRVSLAMGSVPEPPIVKTVGPNSGVLINDADNLYWFDGNGEKIVRLSKANPGMTVELAGSQGSPSEIAVDDQYVYWGSWIDSVGTIKRARIDGSGSPVVEHLVEGVGSTVGIAVDRDNVYWLEFPNNLARMAPKRVGAQAVTIATGLLQPEAIVATGGSAYFSSAYGDRIMRYSVCEGQLHDGLSAFRPGYLLVVGDYVYFSETGRLRRFAK